MKQKPEESVFSCLKSSLLEISIIQEICFLNRSLLNQGYYDDLKVYTNRSNPSSDLTSPSENDKWNVTPYQDPIVGEMHQTEVGMQQKFMYPNIYMYI